MAEETNRLVETDVIEALAATPTNDDFGAQTAAMVAPEIDKSLETMVSEARAQPFDGVIVYKSTVGRDLGNKNRMFNFKPVANTDDFAEMLTNPQNNIRAIILGEYNEEMMHNALISNGGKVLVYLDMDKFSLPPKYKDAVFIPGKKSPARPKILAEIIGHGLPKDSVDRKTGYRLTEDMVQGYNDLTALRSMFQKTYGTVVGMMITNGSLGKPKGDAELYVQLPERKIKVDGKITIEKGEVITYKLTELVGEKMPSYVRALTGLAILAVEHSKAHGTNHYSNSQTALQRIGLLLDHLDKRNNYERIRDRMNQA